MADEMMTLEDLIQAQHFLQVKSFDLNLMELPDEQRMEALRWNVLALTDELHEMLQETGWKPWASSNHVHEDAAAKEMADALHFFANLCLLLNISGPQLARLYLDKREVNAKRQEDGYTGLDKCSNCGRDYQDVGRVRDLCIPCFREQDEENT